MAMIATSSKMSDAEIVQEVFEQASKLDDLTRVDILTRLNQEATLRFPSFTSNDAFQIGSIIRAKFLAKHLPYSAFKAESTISSIASTVSSDEDKLPEWANRGIVVSISTFTGHTLFACTVGAESESHLITGFGKLAAAGKTQEAANLPFPEYATHGGAFPVWLQNAPSSRLPLSS
ncbi:hypothetical protein RhiXN_07291 [Rhizoctonia solani]|uniref:Uncharacterized protein n=1 Tax=Rhizoctonia solani TaxID=456999 RepID=A0A8H8P6R3_9AGAM|nr:uncharacterized protein RhiXN_07291 [Rhizoctonia solani]QRW25342.1 hypothetical protein RhiXN_07291 [Rhizoctonia solani]